MKDLDPFLNSKATILIVDDNNRNLQIIGSILKESNYKVAAAKDGPGAIKLANKIKPDLILLDIMMPGMSGFEVCSNLKSNSLTKNIPVIFLSARTETEDIVKGFTSGGVDYVTKPFIKEELLARIRNHLIIRFNEKNLKNLIKARDKFFSIIAHDLKGPVTTLISLVELVNDNLEKYPKEKLKKLMGGVHDSALVHFKLLENLLEWSRIQTGRLQIKPENFDMLEVINDTIATLKATAASKQLWINVKGPSKVLVHADKDMISTVLRNLLSNALKFSHKKSEILIEVEKLEVHTRISVIDHGVGLSSQKIETLFDINSGSTLGTNKEKGTGLGLVLCKEFVEQNDGDMSVTSEEGKGAAFTFTVPNEV